MAFVPTAPASQIASVLSTTLRAVAQDSIADNVTNGHVLYHWLNAKGHKKTLDGGQSIQCPVMLAQNTTAESYEGYEAGDHDPQEGLTMAMYPWKQARVSISISGIERFMNGGQWMISDQLAWKIDQATISLQELMNYMLYRFGTANGGKDFLGLAQIVSTAPSANTCGMISTSNTAWQNIAVDGDTTISSWATMRHQMRNLYNQCSRGRDHPTILLGNQGAYEYYEASLATLERYQNVDVASGEFEGLMFKGAPFFFDQDMPLLQAIGATSAKASEYGLYMLNHKHLWLCTAKGADFTPDDFAKPSDQDAWKAWIYVYGNIITDIRHSHGVLYNILNTITA